MRLAVVTVLALAIAGCVSPLPGAVDTASTDAAADDPFAGFPNPLVHGHDHKDVAAHKLATPNMQELAWVDFAAPPAVPTAAFGEADLLGKDHLLVAALLQGFYVLDVKDRAHPKVVSFTPDPGYVADIKASEDGNFAFVGVQLAGGAVGVHAYNVQVRERPVFVGEMPLVGAGVSGGCHMLAVHKGYLYCAPNDATVRIYQIVTTPATATLVPVGAYAPKGAPPAPVLAGDDAGREFTHDMTVQDDPVTGKPVMLVSFWNHGVRVVDVSDPAKPVELGAWQGEGAGDTWTGSVHTSMAGLIGGKRVVVTVPENAPIPVVTVIDATDYAHMAALDAWAPQTDLGGESVGTFSMHNFQLLGSRIYLAMYHGGVWVLDASDPAHVKPAGYILPAAASRSVPGLTGAAPDVWDVVLRDGHIYATDIGTGLHVLALDGDIGNETLTSWA